MKKYKLTTKKIRSKIISIRKAALKNKKIAQKKKDELIFSLTYMIKSSIRKYGYKEFDDLYQEGICALIKAIDKYDVASTFSFFRYAMWWIDSAIFRFKYINNYKINATINIEPNNIIYDTISLNRAINKLPELHKKIIIKKYGLDANILDTKELSALYSLSYERIRQIEKESLIKLKNIL